MPAKKPTPPVQHRCGKCRQYKPDVAWDKWLNMLVCTACWVMLPYVGRDAGAKGGKWYRDGAGHIRYGEKPMPKFKQDASAEHTAPHLGHYRPAPFSGMKGIDRDLTGFLMNDGSRYGFTKPELRFLGSWYGTNTKPGALFDAFLDCAGLTRDDLKVDAAQLRFGSQNLTYEEAVFEFFAAQRSLFMGDDTDDEDRGEDPEESWEHILNDEIRPLLDSVFSKYEATDDGFKDSYAAEPERLRRRFFSNTAASAKETSSVADHIMSGWDPEKQAAEVISGMEKLGLFVRPSKVDAKAHVHDRPHLKGATELDDRLLSDQSGNPLVAEKEKLAKLTSSQLMLLYVAAELHRRWDPDTRSYSDERQEDIGPGMLGEVVFSTLAEKPSWSATAGIIRKHLDSMVDRVVVVMNRTNVGLDQSSDGVEE